MALAELYSMSAVTISTTEISIVSGTSTLQTITTDGVYQLWIDAATMAKGDEFKIQIYEKVKGAGAKRVVFSASLSDAQSELFVTPTLILMHGWDMTIMKVAGTDRAFDASIRQVA
jgi:hypothetical protein